MIKNGFPKPQPQIQQPQATGQPPRKPAGNEVTQGGRTEKQRIVGPSRSPGQDHEQHPERRAQRHKQQRPQALQPDPPSVRRRNRRRIAGQIVPVKFLRPAVFGGRVGIGNRGRWNGLGVGGHTALPRCGPRNRSPVKQPDGFSPIGLFYGLKALIRSATSR